eukprot:3513083-Prymnesium_polylepis.1
MHGSDNEYMFNADANCPYDAVLAPFTAPVHDVLTMSPRTHRHTPGHGPRHDHPARRRAAQRQRRVLKAFAAQPRVQLLRRRGARGYIPLPWRGARGYATPS